MQICINGKKIQAYVCHTFNHIAECVFGDTFKFLS